jgi:hypothetical protein
MNKVIYQKPCIANTHVLSETGARVTLVKTCDDHTQLRTPFAFLFSYFFFSSIFGVPLTNQTGTKMQEERGKRKKEKGKRKKKVEQQRGVDYAEKLKIA